MRTKSAHLAQAQKSMTSSYDHAHPDYHPRRRPGWQRGFDDYDLPLPGQKYVEPNMWEHFLTRYARR